MKNNLKFFNLLIFLIFAFHISANGNEQFNFNVTEIEITEDGNKYKGSKRGVISTNDGLIINADNFVYDKNLNLLNANGNIIIEDPNKELKIFADKITYLKDQENIIGENNLKIIIDDILIEANKFEYLKLLNILNINKNVIINNIKDDLVLYAEDITYFENQKKLVTKGNTEIEIQSRYNFKSKNVTFLKDQMKISADDKTILIDNKTSSYELDQFTYQINDEFLKGINITLNENIQIPKSETNQLFFKNGFFDLKNNKFLTGETEILFKKDIFNNANNDPRLKGASAKNDNGITTLEKSVFTSCKQNDKCPPWHIQAKRITHDKNKKQIKYDDAIIKIYDLPVFYFPKFFHPDPSVKRQSGFLKPRFSSSKALGFSFSVPYFYALSENKDFTFKPSFFAKQSQMVQSEYRQENKKSSFITDFALIKNFKPSQTNKRKNINHIFSKFKMDLDFTNFETSDLDVSIQKVSNDTYLKVFDNVLSNTKLKPNNNNVLTSEINLSLDNEKYSLNTGISAYEDLQKNSSDRYQFVFPYYDFSSNILNNSYGTLDFISRGNNDLKNTNNLKTKVINDLNFRSQDKIFYNYGAKNNFGIYLKNANTVAKNDANYTSHPQLELMSIFELNSSIPMIKENEKYVNSLTPRISLRVNPSDMKNNSNNDRSINVDNIYDIDRLSLEDTIESGESITYGIVYRKESLENSEKYISLNLASVLRMNEEKNIPNKTTLNKKNSNIFGSIDYNFSKFFNVEYDFSVNNNFNTVDYNSIGLGISVNNFVTKFNFIEENNVMGDENSIENSTTYQHDENNHFSFKTRRNRKINLTEYYDLVYEYKNDCLTAGIKYRKTYYEDRDLKPTENLLFSITLIPLTSFEQKIGSN